MKRNIYMLLACIMVALVAIMLELGAIGSKFAQVRGNGSDNSSGTDDQTQNEWVVLQGAAPQTLGKDAASTQRFEKITSQAVEAYLQKLRLQVQRFQLANGIRVLFIRNGIAPVVSLHIKFLAGAYDEQEGQYGIAHMLEHMLFKGTKKIGTRDYGREKKYLDLMDSLSLQVDHWQRMLAQKRVSTATASSSLQTRLKETKLLLEILQRQQAWFVRNSEDAALYQLHGGIRYNAYTSSDLTNYTVDLPAERLALWAALESDRMQHAIQRNFYTERNVVREERALRLDNQPRYLLMETFKKEIYQDFPYAHSIIGLANEIAQMDHLVSKRFYETYYRPEKMVITVAGNFDADKTRKIIETTFAPIGMTQQMEGDGKGGMKRMQEPKRLSLLSAQQMAARIETLRRAKKSQQHFPIVQQSSGPPVIYLAWLKPPYSPENSSMNKKQQASTQAYANATASLDIFSHVLGNSADSRLYKRLVNQEKLASQVQVFTQYPGFRDINLFFIRIVPLDSSGKTFSMIQNFVQEEIQRPISQEELAMARAKKRMGLIAIQSNGGKAELVSYYESLANDFQELFSYYENIEKVTPSSIAQAIRLFLASEHGYSAHTTDTIDTTDTTDTIDTADTTDTTDTIEAVATDPK